jgi:hypothetical protein
MLAVVWIALPRKSSEKSGALGVLPKMKDQTVFPEAEARSRSKPSSFLISVEDVSRGAPLKSKPLLVRAVWAVGILRRSQPCHLGSSTRQGPLLK